jgi:hypothetical protein
MNEIRISVGGVCPHEKTVVKQLPPGCQHYAELRCACCGSFMRWLPSPQNIERRKANAFRLAKLQMLPGLTAWEHEFLRSLANQGGKLSPKQQEVFDRLCNAYAIESEVAN